VAGFYEQGDELSVFIKEAGYCFTKSVAISKTSCAMELFSFENYVTKR
jgi:hypothetical protein